MNNQERDLMERVEDYLTRYGKAGDGIAADLLNQVRAMLNVKDEKQMTAEDAAKMIDKAAERLDPEAGLGYYCDLDDLRRVASYLRQNRVQDAYDFAADMERESRMCIPNQVWDYLEKMG